MKYREKLNKRKKKMWDIKNKLKYINNHNKCKVAKISWEKDKQVLPWQWTECQPVNQRVTGSIPSQDTRLGCRPGPQLGACERQPHIDVSFPLFLPPFPSLKINK